jgi:XTP/dITP diphosphohydrolase
MGPSHSASDRAGAVAARRPAVILLATRNAGKLRELRGLVETAGFRAESLEEAGMAERPEEEGLEVYDTFAENARAKAAYFVARAEGRAVLAEDSGLCVEALGGAPGVRSKRWGARRGCIGAALDAANCERLLAALQGAPTRRAWYACAAVLCWGDAEWSASGETRGEILEAPCGAGGFGYDPYFWSTELSACFGAISGDRKATVSHRARAVRAVLADFSHDFSSAS